MEEEPKMYKYRYLGIIGGSVLIIVAMHELMRYVMFCHISHFCISCSAREDEGGYILRVRSHAWELGVI
jgi:hypothetical protein